MSKKMVRRTTRTLHPLQRSEGRSSLHTPWYEAQSELRSTDYFRGRSRGTHTLKPTRKRGQGRRLLILNHPTPPPPWKAHGHSMPSLHLAWSATSDAAAHCYYYHTTWYSVLPAATCIRRTVCTEHIRSTCHLRTNTVVSEVRNSLSDDGTSPAKGRRTGEGRASLWGGLMPNFNLMKQWEAVATLQCRSTFDARPRMLQPKHDIRHSQGRLATTRT